MFTHDVELGLQAAMDLVNTLPGASDSREDELTTLEDLDRYVAREGFSGARRHDPEELTGVRALRSRIDALWAVEDDLAAAEVVNAMLVDGAALPQLVDHDGVGLHIHATRADAPLADRMMVEFAMAWVDVLRQQEHERLRRCAADDCTAVLVDLSRNRSRRFCSTGCSNRMAARAFRARSAAQ